ncbi:hypothetical protein Q3G72_001633 [Acer saccharum]|nr:hypothetical protein Q3G72_001633 [Acer saccharum]
MATLNVEERLIKVEYENLGSICFTCGRYGHSKDSCKEGLVEPVREDQEIIGNKSQDNTEKEKPPYGPWLLVSYGRQGSRGYNGRHGSTGDQRINNSGSGPLNGKHTGAGKNVGSFPSNGKRIINSSSGQVNEAEGIVRGKLVHDRGGVQARNLNVNKSHIASTSSGSRFDVLGEEVDVAMADDIGQVSGPSEAGGKTNDKVVLTDVTNQGFSKTIATPRLSTHNSKKVVKKGKKPSLVVGPMEANQKGVDFYKKSFVLDKVNSSVSSNQGESDFEGLDNASVLRQLHSDVNNFDGNSAATRGAGDGSSSVDNGPNIDSFDRVASQLGEAMAAISE